MWTMNITLAKQTAVDKFNKQSFGLAITYESKVNYKNTKILNSNNEIEVASGVVWFKQNIQVSLSDQITLPDGRQPRIIAVEQRIESNADLTYTKVFFV